MPSSPSRLSSPIPPLSEMLQAQTTPHISLVALLPLLALLLHPIPALPIEREALLHFKSLISSDPSGILSGWVGSAASGHCAWRGITCDSRSRVVALDLSIPSRPRLRGELSPAIGRLSELRVLALPWLGLQGEIPGGVVALGSLEVLDLRGNSLAGPLPARFGRRLRVVELGLNGFRGEIPRGLSYCSELELLDLSRNRLSGTIPPWLGGMDRLRGLYLSFNRLGGVIPAEMGEGCGRLEHLELAGNRLVGGIPASLGNCVELRSLVLSSNSLEGGIPADIGRLRKLQSLDVSRNRLSGCVPAELSDCLELAVIVLSNVYDGHGGDGELNRFESGIDGRITRLPKLRVLWAPWASLEGRIPVDWGSCRSLEMVNLGGNLLVGELPRAFSSCRRLKYLNLSSNELMGELDRDLPVPCMDVFDISGNQLSGSIPNFTRGECASSWVSSHASFFGRKVRLGGLLSQFGLGFEYGILHDFGSNNFSGSFPSLPVTMERLQKQTVYALLMNGNNLFGSFPQHLLIKSECMGGFVLDISDNLISGRISSEIGSVCGSLMVLDASGNEISGTIPFHLGLCSALKHLDLSRNRLQGQIPESFGLLKHLKHLSLADNNLIGGIPTGLGRLQFLEVLDLSSNFLSGEVPNEFIALGNISVLLLNNNMLSGRIPMFIDNTTSISVFNVSHNNFSGPMLSSATTLGNLMLKPCQAISSNVPSANIRGRSLESMQDAPPGKNSGFSSIEIASISSAAAIVSVLFALIIIYIYTRKCAPKAKVQASGKKELTVFINIGIRLTYENVVRATGNFNTSNCIGSGGFGATYKAEIAPGVVVAIKRLFVGKIQGVQQFHAEIKTLGRWRHPNLVTLIGFHVSEAEMFLIYNYLPGGNLERFISNRHKRPVDWRILHKIALDVACALAYLHDQCVPRILHRDVKPSNILLDNDFNAYLSDFGLARLLGNSETHATTGVAGTFGYVAPEYAMTCRVSDKADVYSYGVVLLELLSDKKALDPSFSSYGNGFNIVTWATMLLKKGKAREFFTEGLWGVGPSDDLIETLDLALKCTVDSLTNRLTMKQVVQQLRKIQP